MKTKLRRLLVPTVLVVSAALGLLFAPAGFARGVVVGLVTAVAVLFGGLMLGAHRMKKRLHERLSPPPIATGSWDYGMDARRLDSESIHFSQFAGEVLILNVWATWCAPCVAEMPSLRGLLDATSDVGVSMACVTSEDPKVVSDFVAKRQLDVPVYLYTGELPECFQTRSIPATFVLDKDGNIALRHNGAARWDDERVVSFVRGLAAAPSG